MVDPTVEREHTSPNERAWIQHVLLCQDGCTIVAGGGVHCPAGAGLYCAAYPAWCKTHHQAALSDVGGG